MARRKQIREQSRDRQEAARKQLKHQRAKKQVTHGFALRVRHVVASGYLMAERGRAPGSLGAVRGAPAGRLMFVLLLPSDSSWLQAGCTPPARDNPPGAGGGPGADRAIDRDERCGSGVARCGSETVGAKESMAAWGRG